MSSPFWEGFLLFLIEIGFMIIIGLMYTGMVLTALVLTDWLSKILYKIKEKIRRNK